MTGTIRDIVSIAGGAIVIGTILAAVAVGLINLPKMTRKTLSSLAGVAVGIVMAMSIITFLERLAFWCYDHNVVWVPIVTIAGFIGGCVYLARCKKNS